MPVSLSVRIGTEFIEAREVEREEPKQLPEIIDKHDVNFASQKPPFSPFFFPLFLLRACVM